MAKKKTKYITLDDLKERRAARTEEDRRADGHMTIDEFIEKFSYGLRLYMNNNWRHTDKDAVHHPEDLTSNMLCYAEAVYETVQVFGMGNTNKEE